MAGKVEALINGLRKLAHAGELDRESMMKIGPKIGIHRHDTFGFGGGGETEAEYFKRIQQIIKSEKGLAQLERYYEKLSLEGRRSIGRTVNQNRIQYV